MLSLISEPTKRASKSATNKSENSKLANWWIQAQGSVDLGAAARGGTRRSIAADRAAAARSTATMAAPTPRPDRDVAARLRPRAHRN